LANAEEDAVRLNKRGIAVTVRRGGKLKESHARRSGRVKEDGQGGRKLARTSNLIKMLERKAHEIRGKGKNVGGEGPL